MKYNFNDPNNKRFSDIELDLKQHTHNVSALRQSGATNGQVLTWSDSQRHWIPATPSGGPGGGATILNDLNDVTLSSPLNNQILVYNSSTSQWVNQTPTAVITDHSALTGLGNDDHTQYFNLSRGDSRYSQLGHTHAIADVTGLQTALNGKAPLSHTHDPSDINDGGAAVGQVLTYSGLTWVPQTPATVITDHSGLTGLGNDDHTQYFNISRGDARYSQLGHIHAIADVTGLQTALDGKAALIHTHAIADVTGLQTALDGKAALSHTHAIADVTGLQTALDGKAALVHTHAIADVTGLQTALDGKAALSHTHSLSNITQSGASTNDVPSWNGSSWVPTTLSVGVTDHSALTGLGNDDHTQYFNISRGDARYALINHTHSLSDITQSGASGGQVPIWNALSSSWVPGTVSGSGANYLDDLSDVDLASWPPSTNWLLQYNGAQWIAVDPASVISGVTGSDETALVWMFGG